MRIFPFYTKVKGFERFWAYVPVGEIAAGHSFIYSNRSYHPFKNVTRKVLAVAVFVVAGVFLWNSHGIPERFCPRYIL